MRCALVLVVCAACAKIDEPTFEVPLINVVSSSSGTLVTAPEYEMHFGADLPDSFENPFPDSLLLDGKEVLGAAGACNNEKQIGIAMFPTVVASADSPNSMFVDQTEVSNFLGGPFVAKIDIKYTLAYQCDGTQQLHGESIFTFFPHGRIVRQDFDLRPSSTTLTVPDMCECQPTSATNFAFTSFWTFAGGGETEDDNGTAVTTDSSGTNNMGFGGACTRYTNDNYVVGVRYAGLEPDGTTLRLGTSRIRAMNSAAFTAHVFDLDKDASVGPTTPPRTVFSAIQLIDNNNPGTSCETILGGLAEPPLLIDDSEQIPSAGEDGIYDLGFRDKTFDVTVIGNVDAPLDTTFVVELPSPNVAISKDPPPADGKPVAHIQREGAESSRVIFVLTEPLGSNARITIEPQ